MQIGAQLGGLAHKRAGPFISARLTIEPAVDNKWSWAAAAYPVIAPKARVRSILERRHRPTASANVAGVYSICAQPNTHQHTLSGATHSDLHRPREGDQ